MQALRLSIIVFVALLQAGCWQSRAPSPVLVRVNGQEITQADLELERSFYQFVPNAERPSFKREKKHREFLLQGLIDQRLIEQRAREVSVMVSDREVDEAVRFHSLGASSAEFEKAIKERSLVPAQWKKRLRRQALAEELFRRENDERVVISEDELRDYYWEHVTRYRRPRRVKLRQIVCEKSEQADAALSELLLGDPFEEVAHRYSQGPEASRGGLIGWVRRKDLPLEIEKIAFKLKKMALSPVIQSKYGWHILRVDAKEKARNLSLEEAIPQVRERIKIEKEQALYQDWLFGLRRDAEIEWFSVPEKMKVPGEKKSD